MYTVTVYASWDALSLKRVRLHGTFQLRGAAMEAADTCAYPIVDVRDIGSAGRCPARPSIVIDGVLEPQGHRFACAPVTGNRWECGDCQADQDDLYMPGTFEARPPDDRLVDGSYYGRDVM